MSGNEVVFTPYEIKDCLFDTERTLNLRKAIEEQVKEGDIVLEAGGGTGILSIFAVLAGAEHAYVIELSSRFTDIIRTIAERNGISDKITVINGDATSTDIPVEVDVYISELLCTGLFNEPQIQAYNNLSRFFADDVTCIPQSVTSHIAFAEAETRIFGIDIACDSYLAEDITHRVLTDFTQYMHIEFDGNPVMAEIFVCNDCDVLSMGTINSALIVSSAMLSPTIEAGKSKFLFNPELIFLKDYWVDGLRFGQPDAKILIDNELTVDEEGDSVGFEINYMTGCDTLDVNLRVW